MKEPKEPIGKFIIDNENGTQTENGVYYHYTEVCRLLKLYEKQLILSGVSQQRELLKKWWKYFDKESVAVNCNGQEREEVINDFFNCG